MRKRIITKESIFLDARDKEDILEYYGNPSYSELAKMLKMDVGFIHKVLNGVKPVPASLYVYTVRIDGRDRTHIRRADDPYVLRRK